MALAVTGATGHFGRLVIDHLLTRGTPAAQIVALVRRPENAQELAEQGVRVRPFDYDRAETLAPALEEIDSLLLVSGNQIGRRGPQHRAVIDAAVAAGVGRLLYTSAPHADASVNPVAPEHKETEEYIAASHLPFLILRNGWYHENFLADLTTADQTGVILTAAGDGRIASASRSDLADAAAVLLAGTETGRTLTLTGDVAWSYDDLAGDFSTVLEREIRVQKVSPDEKLAALSAAGVDPGVAGFIVGVDQAVAAGELGDVNHALSGIIGRATSPILDTLRAGV